MGEHSNEMYRCLRDCDTAGAMKLWKHVKPDMPQPENEHQALVLIHYARTQMRKMPNKLRFYSHCWLVGESLPSALPDNMRPRAQRMYPIIVKAVGVGSGSFGGVKRPFNIAIQSVMVDAVKECQADGYDLGSPVVKNRILEKRAEFKKRA
jgi:hypothetical protein